GKAAPVLRRFLGGYFGKIGPADRCKAGLGSNVSTCEGPPFMKRWMTRLALPGKCGALGVTGETTPTLAWATSLSTLARLSAPKPSPQRQRNCRRVRKWSSKPTAWLG